MPSFANKQLNNLVDAELEHLYELHPGMNDRTLGRMYALKQFEKAASEEYALLRKGLDTSNATDERTVICKDAAFQAVAQTRAGSSKVDSTLLMSGLREYIMQSFPSVSSGEAMNTAQGIISRATVFNNDVTTVSVIKS